MTKARDIEQTVLDNAVTSLREKGFDVYVRPSKNVLPEFLHGFEPDAVAFGEPENIVVEVVTDSASSRAKAEALSAAVAAKSDWKVQLHRVLAVPGPRILPIMPPEVFEPTIQKMELLIGEGLNAPALLFGWATLEALGRILIPSEFAQAQTPGRLVEVLASQGYVTPTEADHLRDIATLRNMVVHGDLQAEVRNADVKELVRIAKTLRDQYKADQQG